MLREDYQPDDGIESGDEDELFFAEKEWKKMNEKSTKEGFREGIGKASEDALQDGFDKGYAESFQVGIFIGKLRGKVVAKKIVLGEGSEHIVKLDAIESELNKCENLLRDSPDRENVVKVQLENLETSFQLIPNN